MNVAPKLKSFKCEDKISSSNLFHITSFDNEYKPKLNFKSENFQIIWVQHGSAKITIDHVNNEINNTKIFSISPGQLVCLTLSPGVTGVILSFHAEIVSLQEEGYDLLYCSGVFSHLSTSRTFTISPTTSVFLNGLISFMRNELDNSIYQRFDILKNSLKLFLLCLKRDASSSATQCSPTRDMLLVTRFMAMLDERYKKYKRVSEYADCLAVTANRLNVIVKKVTGKTASQQIQQRIILEAKRQAFSTMPSMKEISMELGFVDNSHFSKYFKNAAGVTFSEFRKDFANGISSIMQR